MKKAHLKFSDPNAKLRKLAKFGIRIKTFSLPAGWTCPSAGICRVKVARDGGLKDAQLGADQLAFFRCFAASDESQYPETRAQRWHNFDALKGLTYQAMVDLISESLPPRANTIRIHVSGDFFNTRYFLAWCRVAVNHPSIRFYAYTKSLNVWTANLSCVPSNLVLTASYGGLHDHLIEKYKLKTARVVFSVAEANRLGLPIDHDDTHAMDRNCQAFALLIHHTQPAGSSASQAMRALNGLGSYSNDQATNSTRAKAVDQQIAA